VMDLWKDYLEWSRETMPGVRTIIASTLAREVRLLIPDVQSRRVRLVGGKTVTLLMGLSLGKPEGRWLAGKVRPPTMEERVAELEKAVGDLQRNRETS
jgi:hypothetical protein